MANKPTLEELRVQIDGLDQQIQTLISQRAVCAQKVAEVKKEQEGENVVYYRPEREAQVLKRVMERNTGPIDGETMARLFREIMSACLALEQRMRIAFFGPEGSFTHAAAQKHFGHAVELVPLATIDEVFREVESGAAHYGVVPVENSTEGVVNHTLDTFMDSSLKINGEVELRIHHHLLTSDVTQPAAITRIYSHQQSLAQCRKWLDAHFPKAERIPVSNNAEAAKRVKGEWNAAAIAGEIAGEMYGLQFHARNIEDYPNNTTRFLIIGPKPAGRSGDDKTSIIVEARNKPGALFQLLEPFHRHNISLTRIETRPSKTSTWSYVFFIDFEGHEQDDIVKDILHELEKEAVELKLLGSYPKAVL
ncbi:MAG TPA: prephenate dehydratase [Pseudomonadales bacterium]|nr:prephenate dehydratase [Pseudomonadales bacterium]